MNCHGRTAFGLQLPRADDLPLASPLLGVGNQNFLAAEMVVAVDRRGNSSNWDCPLPHFPSPTPGHSPRPGASHCAGAELGRVGRRGRGLTPRLCGIPAATAVGENDAQVGLPGRRPRGGPHCTRADRASASKAEESARSPRPARPAARRSSLP